MRVQLRQRKRETARICVCTLVLCQGEDGKECHKKIEDVEVGDLVWAYDEETGTSDWKPVVQLFRNSTSSWICTEVEVDGKEKIKSTPGHMYYLLDNTENRNAGKQLEYANCVELSENWVSAEDLKKGDKVLLSDGRYGIVKGIKLEKLDKPKTTYKII